MLLQHVLPPSGFHGVRIKIKSEDGKVTGISLFEGGGKKQRCDCTTSFSISIFLQKQGCECGMLLKCSLETKLPCAFVESGMALVWSFHQGPVLSRVGFCSLPHLPEQKGNVRLLFPFYRDSELEIAGQNMCMHIYNESNSYINANTVFHSCWT